MTHFVNALTFLFVITPFSQGCTTKLMEGKDKDENKKEIILLLRKVADMLEELEDPIMDNVDPHLKVDEWGRVKYVEKPLMNADKFQVPSTQSTPVPSTQSTPVPRSPKGGHPPFFGIDVVDYEIPDVGNVGIPDDAGCPLSDLGSPDGCGARMAKGKLKLRSYTINNCYAVCLIAFSQTLVYFVKLSEPKILLTCYLVYN